MSGDHDAAVDDPTFGDTWVYESLVRGIPGLHLSTTQAIGVQFALFETLVVGLAAYYGLPRSAVVAGTIAVAVAAAGSVAMLYIGAATRGLDLPVAHRRLLFGSSVEVLFGVLGFVAAVTYLLTGLPTPFESLLGARPPAPVVFVTLLILWDLCYRIGVSWWTALVSLWRSLRIRVTPDTARGCRRIDAANVGFALLELGLLPVVADDALAVGALVGHVVAVTVVSAAATLLLRTELP
ncbi:DUF7530 family protein [Haloplanus aerogenes]|uniref:Uncharacterized protein n=1 Tax=Haloplanus aerogenes TaxID=660522 RepID=A0A3M0CWX8_9EURY|nr:hypothetical protein [Haloplanus aerogenes]AZH23922.1 hypothetical protein DU502_00380 [Haloplanus aerogenes]RMB13315.1 hypothetical protein ATH50_2648 [Haloplanus aerogenes]